MSATVGAITAELKADPSVWEAALKRSVDALEKMAARAEQTSTRFKQVNSESSRLAQAFSLTEKGAAQLNERFGRFTSSINQMSTAVGSAGGRAAQALQGFQGLAQGFASGGLVGVGIAAGTAAINKLTEAMEESEKQAQALLDAFDKAVAKGIEARTAATTGTTDLKFAIGVEQAKTGDPHHDAVMMREAEIGRQIAATVLERFKIEKELSRLQDQRLHVDGKEREAVEEQIEATKANLAANQVTTNELREQSLIVDKLVTAQERAARAAEAYQRALEASVRALSRRADALTGNSEFDKVSRQLDLEPLNKYDEPGTPEAMSRLADQMDRHGPGPVALSALPSMGTMQTGQFDTSVKGTANAMSAYERALRDGTASLSDIMRHGGDDLKKALTDSAGSLASAFAGGHGFGQLGGLVGAGVGGVIDVATGGATGGLGTQLGGALGSLLGGLLDSLQPVMDATAQILGGLGALLKEGLGSILDTLMPFGQAVGGLLESLAPLLASLAKPLAPFVVLATHVVNALSMLIRPIIGVIEPLLELAMDFLLATPIVEALNWTLSWIVVGLSMFNDAVSKVVNQIVDWIRTIPTMEHFGEKMRMSGDVLSHDWAPSVDKNTKAINKLTESVQNIPNGYKLALKEYQADPGRTSGRLLGSTTTSASRDGRGGGTHWHFHAPITIAAKNGQVLEQLRGEFQRRYGYSRAVGGGPDDDAN